MRRSEIVEAIRVFKPNLAESLSRPASRMLGRDVDTILLAVNHLFANQIEQPEDAVAVIRRAALMIVQQGNGFALEEDEAVQEKIDARNAKKKKNHAAYMKATTTPILSDEDKKKLHKRKLRLGESTVSMMAYIAPWRHEPRLWGAIWDSTASTRRIIVTLINTGVVEVVKYHSDPMLAVIERGPRWDEAVEIYGKPMEGYRHSGGMMSCKPKD